MTARSHAAVLLVLCAVLWSTGGLLIKWIAGPALAVAGMRSAIATIVLLLVLREWRTRWSWWLGSGVLAGAASMLGFVVATKLTTAANAIFLVYTAPLYVALLSPWVLHEPIRRGDWLTLLLAVLGLGCFYFEQLTLEGWVGNLCALGACPRINVYGPLIPRQPYGGGGWMGTPAVSTSTVVRHHWFTDGMTPCQTVLAVPMAP